jgi:hypothetical protein
MQAAASTLDAPCEQRTGPRLIAGLGAKTLSVPTDVSDEAAVNALAAAAVDRFGAVHVVCNNAGVPSPADPWFGPLSAWKWVLGVNLWGVTHGIMLPIGVSVLCPGWVRTSIARADRNWPPGLGEVPPQAASAAVTEPHLRRAVNEGMAPADVADLVADAITANRFWVFTDPRFTQIALDRWQHIAEGHNPQTEVDLPGMPSAKQLTAKIQQLLAGLSGALCPGTRARLDGTTWSRMTAEAAKAPTRCQARPAILAYPSRLWAV